jgi:hypothetical protein
MKEITINYLSHNRLHYSDLMFYFLSKIKPENKAKLKLNILASVECDWGVKCENLGIDYEVIVFNPHLNYLTKINFAVNSDTKYSVKLDEDCFINNYVWDYLIENVGVLDNEEILTLSPTMSNNIPSCDYFIEDFIDDENIKTEIYNWFLKREMPNGVWNVDYTSLNDYTINAKIWNPKNFYDGVNALNTNTKGIHPLRICYEAQMIINNYISNNIEKYISNNDYNIFEIDAPYFTNSMFFIKTSEWVNILKHPAIDSFDEIALNKYKKDNNKKFLFVKNGFGIHPMFNTVYANKNPWNIGGVDGENDELVFYNDLVNKIII